MARLDLPAIEAALLARAEVTARLPYGAEEDAFDAARRMADGYCRIDDLLATGTNPLQLGQSRNLLELNHIVLCGQTPARRSLHADHIGATEAHFYGDHEAGADSFYDWLSRQGGSRAVDFAARVYVRIVSSPQLFIEGNQRTAALCASHVLVAAGHPPLVVDLAIAAAFAPVASACRAVNRQQLGAALSAWRAVGRLHGLLGSGAPRQYLRTG